MSFTNKISSFREVIFRNVVPLFFVVVLMVILYIVFLLKIEIFYKGNYKRTAKNIFELSVKNNEAKKIIKTDGNERIFFDGKAIPSGFILSAANGNVEPLIINLSFNNEIGNSMSTAVNGEFKLLLNTSFWHLIVD